MLARWCNLRLAGCLIGNVWHSSGPLMNRDGIFLHPLAMLLYPILIGVFEVIDFQQLLLLHLNSFAVLVGLNERNQFWYALYRTSTQAGIGAHLPYDLFTDTETHADLDGHMLTLLATCVWHKSSTLSRLLILLAVCNDYRFAMHSVSWWSIYGKYFSRIIMSWHNRSSFTINHDIFSKIFTSPMALFQ